MAWGKTLVNFVRILVNDFDNDELTYTDNQLKRIIVVSANLVQQELTFDTTYTINLGSPDISPDPTVTATRDDAFTNFVALKTACKLDEYTFRAKAVLSGLRASCGNHIRMETTDYAGPFRDLLQLGPCLSYENLKRDWKFGNANTIRAVLSPFTSNLWNPDRTSSVFRGRC